MHIKQVHPQRMCKSRNCKEKNKPIAVKNENNKDQRRNKWDQVWEEVEYDSEGVSCLFGENEHH